jgi:ketosteroid isomerase-like protein
METLIETTKKAKIEALYEAFAIGNIPLILEKIANDFTWSDPCDPAIAPQGGKYHGKDGFLQFFHNLAGSTTTTLWEVNHIAEEGDTVLAIGKHGVTINKTGKHIVIDWAMYWHFENELPVSGGSFIDTARYQQMFN